MRLRGVFRSLTRECCSVLLRSVVQRCRSDVLLKSAACCSEVFFRGVAQKCCPGVPLVAQNFVHTCRSGVLLRRVAQKCRSEVLLGCGAQKFRLEVLLRRVDQKCHSEVSSKAPRDIARCSQICPEVSLRGAAQCCSEVHFSEVSLRSVAQECRRSKVSLRYV